MGRTMTLLAACVSSVLVACSSVATRWEPNGAAGALEVDKAQCQAQARMVPSSGNAALDGQQSDEFFEACMLRMGWRKLP